MSIEVKGRSGKTAIVNAGEAIGVFTPAIKGVALEGMVSCAQDDQSGNISWGIVEYNSKKISPHIEEATRRVIFEDQLIINAGDPTVSFPVDGIVRLTVKHIEK